MFKYELQIVHLVRGVTVCRILNELLLSVYTYKFIFFYFFVSLSLYKDRITFLRLAGKTGKQIIMRI